MVVTKRLVFVLFSCILLLDNHIANAAGGAGGAPSSTPFYSSYTTSPIDFGAVGDCVADDTHALISMRDYLLNLQKNDPTNTIIFTIESPSGRCYKYTNNRWTWGLKRLKLHFNGSSIWNVSNSKWTEDKMAFYSNREAFYTIGYDAPLHSTATISGSLIESALTGSRSVKLIDPKDVSGFKAGAWALVYSYDQQMGVGFPPNARYYDYVKIISINGQILTLDRPLTADHLADFPEIPNRDSTSGRARIIQLDRDIPFCEFLDIDGIKTINNPNITPDASKNYFMVFDTYKLIVTNSEIYSFSPSITHSVTVRNSIIHYIEPDKLIDSVSFQDTNIHRAAGATGVKELTFSGGTIDGMVYLAPRNLHINHALLKGIAYKNDADLLGRNYVITYATNLYAVPVNSINILDSTLIGKNNPADRYFADQTPIALRMDGSQITIDNARAGVQNDLVLDAQAPLAQIPTQKFLSCVEIGTPVLITSPINTIEGFAIPLQITGDTDTVHFKFKFSSNPDLGDNLSCIKVGKILMQKNIYNDWVTPLLSQFKTKKGLPKALKINYEDRFSYDLVANSSQEK